MEQPNTGQRRHVVLFVLFVVAVVLAVTSIAGCGGGGAPPSATDTRASQKDATAAEETSAAEAKSGDTTGSETPAADTSGITRDGGTTIVDSDRAVKAGPSAYWHNVTGVGYNNNMIWTYVNGSVVCNYMVWRSGRPAGRYQVIVWIPRANATTRSAHYKVEFFVGNNYTVLKEVVVNQYAVYDAWVDLGTYDFAGEPAVFLGDNTGEAYSTKCRVGFDAVGFVSKPSGSSGSWATNVPCYYQGDRRWASKKLSPSRYTMSNSGCLVTSEAAVASGAGVATDPGEFCDWLSGHGGFTSGGYLTSDAKIAAYTQNRVVCTGTASSWHNRQADLNRIRTELDAGRPVILEVHTRKNDSENYMHWVVAVSYSLSGSTVSDITIMDPLNSNPGLISITKYTFGDPISRRIYDGKFYARK